MTAVPVSPRKTLRDHLRALGGALLIVGITFGLIEFGLQTLDPWGLHYFQDLGRMSNDLFVPDPQRGYTLPPATYIFSHWRATVTPQGRLTPATAPAATCELAILGDSVAFGYGVNDDEVWVNQVAAALPDVTLRNYGIPRYNSTNVLLTQQAFPDAAGYLYLIINNDIEPPLDVVLSGFAGSGAGLPWLVRYLNFAMYRGGGSDRIDVDPNSTATLPDSPDLRRMTNELNAILAHGRTRLAAFRGERLTNALLERGYDLILATYPASYRISLADYHLNAAGNRLLAEALLPTIKDLQKSVCPA